MQKIELTPVQKAILAGILIAAAICAALSKYVMFLVPATECKLLVIPGQNATVENGQIVLNITRSLLNETLHVLTLKVSGNCIFSIIPEIRNVSLRFTYFKVYFIVNNRTRISADLVKIGNVLKASNIVEVRPNATVDMYIRTDASIGLAYIDIIIKQVQVSK